MNLKLFKPKQSKVEIPFISSRVRAGFPSAGESHIEQKLDLNEHLIKNPTATYFVQVSGNSMINAGIKDGDTLVVDRSLEPIHNKIVVASIDGEFTLKRIVKENNKVYLKSENPEFKPIEITEENELLVWGVVTYVIHKT